MGYSKGYDLNDYARTLISHKARQLIGRHGFVPDDREVLEHEMSLDLLLRLENFDPCP